MPRKLWMVWLIPVAIWGVSMCWLAGYERGYEQGHNKAWDDARTTLMPTTAFRDLTPRDQLGGIAGEAPSTAPVVY